MDQALEQPRLVQITPPSVAEAWEMVSSQLRMEMRAGEYISWVEPLHPIGYKEGVFRIWVSNEYVQQWVESRLLKRITGLLEGIYHHTLQVHLTLRSSAVLEEDAGGPSATAPEAFPVVDDAPRSGNGSSSGSGRKKKTSPDATGGEGGSARKIQLQRAYGTERARVIQPERGMFLTMYFFNNWLPLLGQSALTTIIAARSMCYWNPMTGEMRNVVETDMTELASRASVSVRTVKDVLNNELVKRYFLRYKVRRVMTSNGIRTAGIVLQVRMDDPLTPEDQDQHKLTEDERWFTADFDDEE
jgi:hypothetical protein